MVEQKSLLADATRIVNAKLRNSTNVRRAGIATYRTLMAACRFLPPPKILLNGHHKSGTHLLGDCLSAMPKLAFSGRHFTMGDFVVEADQAWRVPYTWSHALPRIDFEALGHFLRRCPNGMFATAHAQHSPELESLLIQLGFRQILLLRDPRDMVVSHTHFVMRQRTHFHHHYYAKVLRTDEERLMATITGLPADLPGVGEPVPSIGENLSGYLTWRQRPGTLVTRYETLVGERGGGTRSAQLHELQRIGAFIDRPLEGSAAADIADRAYGKTGLTYRKGSVGDWMQVFTRAHRDAFKGVAGDLLIELGYEGSHDW